MKAFIEGVKGKYNGRKVELPRARVDIGRGMDNSMIIADDLSLSRKHACIYHKNQSWYCLDLGSSNGTFLNGIRVNQHAQQIPNDAVITCGQQVFKITYVSSSVEPIRSNVSTGSKPPVISPPTFTNETKKTDGWFGQGSVATVQGITLRNSFVYIGEKGSDPSLINPKLQIASGRYNDELPYWPSYKEATPVQRWHYLKWLEAGRVGKVDSGFLFIFFYGVERRLIGDDAEKTTIAERRILLEELDILCTRYPEEHSFHRYCRSLKQSQWTILPDFIQFSSQYDRYPTCDDELYILGMSSLLYHRNPFKRSHAIEIFQNEMKISTKVAADRCEKDAEHLFSIRVNELIGNGIYFAPGKTNILLSYEPANLSLRGTNKTIPQRIIRALEAENIVYQLRSLGATCLEELTPAAKLIGPQPTQHSRNRAEILLPQELRSHSRVVQNLNHFLTEAVSTSSLISLQEIQTELELGDEPLKKVEPTLFDIAEWLGFVIEPDPRLGIVSPAKVKSFAIEKANFLTNCTGLERFATVMRLATILGSIINPQSQLISQYNIQIQSCFESSFGMSPSEGQRISVFLKWLEINQLKLSKATITGIEVQYRADAANVLIQIIKLLGNITADTVKSLAEVLVLWNWNENEVYRAIHNDEPTLIVQETTETGFAIPCPSTRTEAEQPLLDKSRLRELEEQTNVVSEILRDVFDDSHIKSENNSTEILDLRKQSICNCFNKLQIGPLSSEQLSQLGIETKLPIAFLIESINEIAVEKSGSPLIILISDGEYEVDADILEELQNE